MQPNRIGHLIQTLPLKILTLLTVLYALSGCTRLSSFLFYPMKEYYQLPEQLGLKAERVSIKTEDGENLANWFLSSAAEPKGTILFLHGNGENISTHIHSVAWLPKHGYQVFLLDYRGYGRSTGTSSLDSAISDVSDAHQWLTQRAPNTPLILFGQSLGGALAVSYTANYSHKLNRIRALISESAPASWPQIAREAMSQSWITWPLIIPAFFLTNDYDAEDHIHAIQDIPILLMHSKNDPIVGFHHGRQLYENASKQTELIQYEGPHISGLLHENIREKFLEFLDENTQMTEITDFEP